MPKLEAKSPRFNPPDSSSGEGVIGSPGRWTRGAWLFRDDTLHRLEVLLDEAFRIPFTRIRFGIDGIIGLVPGPGRRRCAVCFRWSSPWPRGSAAFPMSPSCAWPPTSASACWSAQFPIVGDAFDIAWKANRRNYQLLHRHLGEPRRHTWKDWVFLLVLACALGLIFAIPIVLVIWLLAWLIQQ